MLLDYGLLRYFIRLWSILISLFAIQIGLIGCAHAESFDFPRADSSVVRLVVVHPDHGVMSGTGVIVSSDGYILTNHHVVQFHDSDRLEAGRAVFVMQKGINGSRDIIEGVVKAVDINTDLALVKINKNGLNPMTLAYSPPLKASQVYALGFPGVADQIAGNVIDDPNSIPPNLIEPTLTQGIISREISSALTPQTQDRSWYQHSAAIHAGNSGGPLMNHCGELVGINTFVHKDGAAAMYFASTLTFVAKFLSDSDIAFNQEVNPCSYSTIEQGGYKVQMWMMVLLFILVLTALTFALRKPKFIKERVVETYTQWRSRNNENALIEPKKNDPIPKRDDSAKWRLIRSKDGKVLFEFKSKQEGSSWVVGRDTNVADITIHDSTVSRAHLLLTYDHNHFLVEDMNTTNGTRVNDSRIGAFKPVAIDENTLIQMGHVEVVLTRVDI